jgi:hypothetical protein
MTELLLIFHVKLEIFFCVVFPGDGPGFTVSKLWQSGLWAEAYFIIVCGDD